MAGPSTLRSVDQQEYQSRKSVLPPAVPFNVASPSEEDSKPASKIDLVEFKAKRLGASEEDQKNGTDVFTRRTKRNPRNSVSPELLTNLVNMFLLLTIIV
jgi:hypothetical protein